MKISRIKIISALVFSYRLVLTGQRMQGQSSEAPVAELLRFPNFEAGTGKIAFAAQASEDVMFDLYFINAGTGKLYQVTENPHSDIAPDFSRDGMRMVFSSDRVDTYDIFTINLPSGSPILLIRKFDR